jgi:hypothetical protein
MELHEEETEGQGHWLCRQADQPHQSDVYH